LNAGTVQQLPCNQNKAANNGMLKTLTAGIAKQRTFNRNKEANKGL